MGFSETHFLTTAAVDWPSIWLYISASYQYLSIWVARYLCISVSVSVNVSEAVSVHKYPLSVLPSALRRCRCLRTELSALICWPGRPNSSSSSSSSNCELLLRFVHRPTSISLETIYLDKCKCFTIYLCQVGVVSFGLHAFARSMTCSNSTPTWSSLVIGKLCRSWLSATTNEDVWRCLVMSPRRQLHYNPE